MTDYERNFRPITRPAGRSPSRPASIRRAPPPAARAPAAPRRNARRPVTARPPLMPASQVRRGSRPIASRTIKTSRPVTRARSAAAVRPGIGRVPGYRPAGRRFPKQRRSHWPRRRWPTRRGFYGWPAGGFVDYPPEDMYPPVEEPNYHPDVLPGICNHGQSVLRRAGLMTGAWQQRLADASPKLHRFIRQFCRTAGFPVVIRRYYGSAMQRSAAALSIRLAVRIAERIPDFQQRIVFEEEIGIAPGGEYLSLRVVLGERHYLLLPWHSLDARAVRKQFSRDMAQYGGLENVRWVLSARKFGGKPKEAIVEKLSRILDVEAFSKEGEPEPGAPANGNGRHLSNGSPDLNRLVIML
jgi:hypothetical protein